MNVRPLSEDDARRVIDYVEGRLTGGELDAFEERLLDDANLARATEDYFEGARHLERAARTTALAAPRTALPPAGKRAGWSRYAAAAAVLIAAAAGALWLGREKRPAFELAILRTGVKVVDYADVLGLDPELVPLESRATRSDGAAEKALSAREFLERARTLQDELLAAALSGDAVTQTRAAAIGTPARPATAGLFAVAVQSAEPFAPVVVVVSRDGAVQRWLPDVAETNGLLPAGVHVLPRPPLTLAVAGESERLDLNHGFVLARKFGVATVLVGARASAPSPAERARVDALQSDRPATALSEAEFAGAVDRAAATLESLGFSVRRVAVNEPTDGT